MTIANRKKAILVLCCILAGHISLGCASAAGVTAALADHVVVIGVDGMSPDGVERAATPNFHRLMREGAYTLRAAA